MKTTKTTLFCALALSFGTAQGQSLLDLLRSIQPGQPADNQPAAPAQATPAPTAPSPTPAQPATPAPAQDIKPVFMSVLTNYTRVTNPVIVTNYVVVTNVSFTTNYYNAQGQLLTLLPGSGATPTVAESKPATPPPPDPAVIRSNRVQAIRELLAQSIGTVSNTLSATGSFLNNPTNQIRIPEGVTVFDRKKSQNLSTAMNTAAEKAVPGACSVLQKIVAQLNPPDPAQVLQGGSDAATRYLVSAEGQNAVNQVLSVVQSAATDAHVPEAYNAVMLRGGGLLGAVLGTAPSVDMNAHITRALMESIILKLSAEEGSIRAEPSKRTTKALQNALK